MNNEKVKKIYQLFDPDEMCDHAIIEDKLKEIGLSPNFIHDLLENVKNKMILQDEFKQIMSDFQLLR